MSRITVSQLDGRLKAVETQLQEMSTGRSGHKPLGHKIGQLHRELASLRRQLAEQGPSPVLAGQIDSLAAAVNDLGSRVGMLEEGQQSLSERIDTGLRAVNGTLEDHGRQLTGLNQMSNHLLGAVARAHARIDAVAAEFNWVAAGIAGGVLGVLWLFWYWPANFGGSVLNAKGLPTGERVPSLLDTPIGTLLGLVVVVLAAVAAGYLFARPATSTTTASADAGAAAQASAGNVAATAGAGAITAEMPAVR